MRTELRISGVGGQGVITLGHVYGRAAALFDKKQTIMTEAYGPEVTGGFARADLIIDDDQIDFPMVNSPDVIIIMDSLGWTRDAGKVREGGHLIIDEDLVRNATDVPTKLTKIPAFRTASELGNKVVANVVMMGAVQELTGIVSKEGLYEALMEKIPPRFKELNEKALEEGYKLGRSIGQKEVVVN